MLVTPQAAKVTATVHGKCLLVKMEKALNMYNILRERPHSCNFYYSILL